MESLMTPTDLGVPCVYHCGLSFILEEEERAKKLYTYRVVEKVSAAVRMKILEHSTGKQLLRVHSTKKVNNKT